ncbi:MAG: hypothetical protein HQ475_03055 [SAR202 cluster bacterium]|nr:hypothetical protein [SAR202 cluster bacterium]
MIAYHVFVDAGRVAQEPIRLIGESARSLQAVVASTEAQMQKVENDARDIGKAVEALPKLDFSFPVDLAIPPITIPPLQVEIPVVTEGETTISPPSLDITVPTIKLKDENFGIFKIPIPEIGSKVDTLTFPSFEVPSVSVTLEPKSLEIPKITGIQIPLPQAFKDLDAALQGVSSVVASVTTTLEDAGSISASLTSAKADLEAIAFEAETLQADTATLARTWAKPVFWTLLASGIALVLSYVVTTVDNLRHSWRLITGKGG